MASDLRFEWDARKAAANVKKHGVSFDEASTAFSDENALLIPDPDHSEDEARFILTGPEFKPQITRGRPLLPRGRGRDPDRLRKEGHKTGVEGLRMRGL